MEQKYSLIVVAAPRTAHRTWTSAQGQIVTQELRWSESRSIILTATAAMAGGTQLFEGAHLTGGNTRFCRESSKCHNYALFVGQIIKYALRIILGFGFVAIKRF